MDFTTQTRIDAIIARAITGIRETKGKEYATIEDTLADFKEVALEAGITPLQCWATYVKKHQRAIDTYIREGAVKSEPIEGRILDVIVYHHLLFGLIVDAQGWSHVLGERIDHAFVADHTSEADEPPAPLAHELPGQSSTPMAHRGPSLDASVPFPHGQTPGWHPED